MVGRGGRRGRRKHLLCLGAAERGAEGAATLSKLGQLERDVLWGLLLLGRRRTTLDRFSHGDRVPRTGRSAVAACALVPSRGRLFGFDCSLGLGDEESFLRSGGDQASMGEPFDRCFLHYL